MIYNNIIAQNVQIVNVQVIAGDDKQTTKWAEKKHLAVAISDKMEKAGFKGRAIRMIECSTELNYKYCEKCNSYEIERANLCRDKLCPVCSWRLALKRYAEMLQVCNNLITAYPECKWSFITLTVKNCYSDELSHTLSEMSKGWNRLLQRKVFKENVKGWARSVEVTYNELTKQVHPHYHILVMWEKEMDHAGEFIINGWLSACKLETTAAAQDEQKISYKEAAGCETFDMTKEVLETFKYTQKATDMLKMKLGDFRNYALQVAGKRMQSFGGIIKEYRKLLDIKENDEPDEMEKIYVCKTCGNKELSNVIYNWSFANGHYNVVQNYVNINGD